MLNSFDLIKNADVPMFSPSELIELKKLANSLPLNPLIVIIGAGVGAASMAILEERKDVVIFSVDIMFPTKQPMYQPGERANLIEAGYWELGRVIQVWGDSQTVGKHWPIQYDWLLIDGDHRYEGVKADIQIWLHHAKPGALVSLHDYAPKSKKPKAGVKQAVDELLGKNWYSFQGTLITYEISQETIQPVQA